MSLTLQGLLVSIIVFILGKLNIPFVTNDVAVLAGSIITVISWVMIYIGRQRLGGINAFGIRK